VTRWSVLSLILTALAFGASAYILFGRYDELPENLPIHWNAQFKVDGTIPKAEAWKAVFGIPAAMAAVCVLSWVLPWLSPRKFTVQSFRATWDYVMMLVTAMMGYLHGVLLWAMISGQEGSGVFMRLFLGGLCLFFVLIGNQLGKVRPNFWMGVRTPWTIASEAVWTRTHRVAAWLFTAAGAFGFLVTMLTPLEYMTVTPLVVGGGILIGSLFPVFYSLYLYKRLEREGRLGPPTDPSREEVNAG
jgi:uncharacterized membrane protein